MRDCVKHKGTGDIARFEACQLLGVRSIHGSLVNYDAWLHYVKQVRGMRLVVLLPDPMGL